MGTSFFFAKSSISSRTASRGGISPCMYSSRERGVIESICYDPHMAFRAVLFDAAETLFTTRGSVGQIYGSIARQYGSTASDAAIQAAFARQFRGAGPLSTQDQKRWWKDVVYRVFSEVGMVT